MTNKEFAIKVCAFLEPHNWVGTIALMTQLDIKETRGFVRSNLKRLRRLGVLEQRGTGKYHWRLANKNYNKENPFATDSTKPLLGKLLSENKVQIGGETYTWRNRIREANGTWNDTNKVWEMPLTSLVKIKDLVSNFEELIGEDKDDDKDPADEQAEAEAKSDPELQRKVYELEQKVELLHNTVSTHEDTISELSKQIATINQTRKVEIVLKDAKGKTLHKTEDRHHPIFEQVLFHVNCGDNVMLVGPKGCGKTFLAKQLAKSLGLAHGMLSLSGGVTEGKIFGRSTPNITNGKQEFHSTPFIDLWEGGGLFLFDEIDAADPNVVLSLNGALADGELPVDRAKKPLAKRHKDFVCIAAANTWGNGADRQYVGRNQQDSAFTERFVQLAMDYDKQMELALCPGAEEMVTKFHTYRDNMTRNRVERTLSTRFIQRAYNWMQHGKNVVYAEERLFDGWRKDEIAKTKGHGY